MSMVSDLSDIPNDLNTLKMTTAAERKRRIHTEAAEPIAEVMSAQMKLHIEKMRLALCGTRSERTHRPIHQMEQHLEELEASASEDDLAA
jgi:transposase